jgi:hypothetical protein
MGAGILPISIYKGKVYLLLSREVCGRDKGLYSDFGGTREKNETIIQTAVREAYEESNGFLGNKQDIYNLIKNNLVTTISIDNYTTYVVEIKYDRKLLRYFRNNFMYSKKVDRDMICKEGYYEKDKLQWVKIPNIYKFSSELRPFYRKILVKHNLLKIISCLKL